MRHYKTMLHYWMCGIAFILILPLVVSAGHYTDFRYPREKQLTKDGYPTPLSGQPITKTPVIAKKKGVTLKCLTGAVEQGRQWCQVSLENAKNTKDLRSLLQSHAWTSFLYTEIGDIEAAKSYLMKSIDYAQKVNWPFVLAACWAYLGEVDYLTGDFERAEHHVKKGLSIQTNAGVEVALSHYNLTLGRIRIEKADFNSAWSNLEKAEYLSNKYSELGIFGATKIYKGRCLGKKENIKSKEAENYFFEGIEICEKIELRIYSVWGYTELGEYFIDTGQNDRATSTLKKAQKMAEGMGMSYWGNKARTLLNKIKIPILPR